MVVAMLVAVSAVVAPTFQSSKARSRMGAPLGPVKRTAFLKISVAVTVIWSVAWTPVRPLVDVTVMVPLPRLPSVKVGAVMVALGMAEVAATLEICRWFTPAFFRSG